MATSDLVKTLNNRGRAYVKLDIMSRAEVDATEVCVCVCVPQYRLLYERKDNFFLFPLEGKEPSAYKVVLFRYKYSNRVARV